jgi:hypothetical protein
VSGYPVFVEDNTQFVGFIMLIVPIITMIPIFDQFQKSTPRTVVATARGSKRLDAAVLSRFGGVLKELHFEDNTGKDHGLYLDTMYYTLLESGHTHGGIAISQAADRCAASDCDRRHPEPDADDACVARIKGGLR